MSEVEKELNLLNSKKGGILFVINAGEKHSITDKVTKTLVKKLKNGIYLSRDTPSKTLIKRLGKNITKNILFIDCISVKKDLDVRKKDVKMQKGVSLPEVAYVVFQKILGTKKYKFVHFDSLQVLFDCFSELEATEFLNFLIKKLAELDIIFVASTLELPKDDLVLKKVFKIFKHKIYLGF